MADIIGVTGASGFIGSNIVKYLAQDGYEVVAFGKDSERNFSSPKVHWRIMDLNNITSKDLEGIDRLIHFAGSYNTVDAFNKNVGMLKKVIDASLSSKIKFFYLISTYAVFGNRETPAKSDDSYNPLEDYSKSKVMAEEEFKRILPSAKFRRVIIRLCSLYGKHGKNFIDLIIEKMKKNEEVQMVHFRNQFLHVRDAYLLLKRIISEKNPSRAYNIEGEVITEQELKKIFEDLGIKYSLIEKTTRSYLCEGLKAPLTHTVKSYLEEAKNAI